MKRRSFLKGVCAIPLFGLTPSLAVSTTPTKSGLDRVISIIRDDKRLNKRVTQEDIEEAINSAKRMNEIILEAIINRGLANDKKISIADTREINDYIFHNYHDEWIILHGNDEKDSETGFHRVVNDGAKTKLFGRNAINRVFDSIYHLGFETHIKNRLLNEDGNKNASYKNVAIWLNSLLKDDLASNRLINPAITEVAGETDTNLDNIIDIIYSDEGLNRKISTGDIRIGANSANEMNKLIIEAINVTNSGSSGIFTKDDIKDINSYLVENHSSKWAELHGDDEKDIERGFHKVQNDGATTKLFGRNAINRVFDSIYHLGFETHIKNRLLNEDGNKNASYKNVAIWLNSLLKDDLASNRLINPAITEVAGETDTNLDNIIDIIYSDEGLNRKISTGDIRIGANSANEMNKLIIEAINVTNSGSSGIFTKDDIKDINSYLVENHSSKWAELHGDDEKDIERGFHKVQNDGATTKLFGRNAINRVFDGIYHLGFATPYKNILVDEDGKKNISFTKVAEWLTNLLGDKLDNQKEDLEILIPLYIYPTNGAWQELIDIKNSNPNISITAIVNPKNGHFNKEDSNYTKAIKELKSANIKIVGYVSTLYGDRDIDEVIADIDAWSRIYKSIGVSGIFFDETSIYIDYLDYYKQLTKEARDRDLNFTILNAGITTDQKYIDSNIANIVVTYEHTARKLLENPPKTYNTPTANTKLSLLVYKLEDNIVDDLISFAREHKFSYIYFTEDGFDRNPWDSISEYLQEEVTKALV